MFTPGSRVCAYKTASGRHEWPNHDPIGEPGFEVLRHGKANVRAGSSNLYEFVKNDAIDYNDPFGLNTSPPSKEVIASYKRIVAACKHCEEPDDLDCLSFCQYSVGDAGTWAIEACMNGCESCGKKPWPTISLF